MAAYTSVTVPVNAPDSDIWQTFVETVAPANWSKTVPPRPAPVIVVVSEPSGQVSFG